MNKQSGHFWETVWNNDQNYGFWKQVSPEVVELIRSQSPDEHPVVLDLGCGLGRNAIAFAQAGFHVTAIDLSPTAISHLQGWARQLDLRIQTLVCDFVEEVFSPESFDIVISINVLYHGYREQLVRAIDNVRHWLKHGGIFYFTCPTRQDGEYGKVKELAPHTFELEPGHLHYCADETDLDRLLVGFKQLSRKRREHQWEKDGISRFSSRWQILVEKL